MCKVVLLYSHNKKWIQYIGIESELYYFFSDFLKSENLVVMLKRLAAPLT
jgi:hypothetical protein